MTHEPDHIPMDFWMESIEESRSEENKGDPISMPSIRGTEDGKLDPDRMDEVEVEGGLARHTESGQPLARHDRFTEAGLDPAENQGFIDTDASGEDDRVELKQGSFEGDYQQFSQDLASLDEESSADMNAAKWTDLDPSGRGNGDTGPTETPPEQKGKGKNRRWDQPPGWDAGPAPGKTRAKERVLDKGRQGARPRRPDGQQGSSIFGGGGDGGSSGDGGGAMNLSPTQKKAAGAAAAGGLGLGALWLLVL